MPTSKCYGGPVLNDHVLNSTQMVPGLGIVEDQDERVRVKRRHPDVPGAKLEKRTGPEKAMEAAEKEKMEGQPAVPKLRPSFGGKA